MNDVMACRRFRRAAALLTALLLLFLLPAAAEENPATTAAGETAAAPTTTPTTAYSGNEKVYRIIERGDRGAIVQEPETPAFWEYPELPAGQRRTGSFSIVNGGTRTVSVKLRMVELPYDDPAALAYLAALHLRVVSSDGRALYDGPYTGVNDTDGLAVVLPAMAPGDRSDYTVEIRCAFDYPGDPAEVTSRLTWLFQAGATVVTVPDDSAARSTALIARVLLIATIVLGGIGVVFLIVRLSRKPRRGDRH